MSKLLKITLIVFVSAFTLGFLSGAITEYSLSEKK